MKTRILFLAVGIVLLSGTVNGCGSEGDLDKTDGPVSEITKKHFPAQDLIGKSTATLPDTDLINQDREAFSFQSLSGKPTLLSFIYTRCPMSDMCPLITRKMKKVQSKFAHTNERNINLVTVTFDPAYDTPGVLKSYAQGRDAELTNWDFVTGPEPVVEELIASFKISTKRTENGQLVHNLRTYLINEKGKITEWYRGSEWSVQEVTDALKAIQ